MRSISAISSLDCSRTVSSTWGWRSWNRASGQRQVDRAHRVHGADRHVAGVHPAQRLQLGLDRLQLGQDPAGADHEELAGLGQRHVAGGALDQGQPELVLEPADLL